MSRKNRREVTLSMICPCYNEADVIAAFYGELKSVLESLNGSDYEIIFVDDGSTDDTLARLNDIAERDPSVLVCSLSRNFGHQIALTAGLDFAAGEAAIMMDTDLQHPPELIPQMVERWRAGCDIVSAVNEGTSGGSWFKDVTSRGFYAILNALSRTHVPHGVADFTLVSRRVYMVLRRMRERRRFVRGMISWVGFDRGYVHYRARSRAAGGSKYSFLRMSSMAVDAVLSFSSTPLILATQIGLLVTFAGFVYLMWILVRALFFQGLVPGWASLIATVLILGGCQLLFIGLIGQYVARVFDEMKGRPVYILKQSPPAPPDAPPGGRDGPSSAAGT